MEDLDFAIEDDDHLLFIVSPISNHRKSPARNADPVSRNQLRSMHVIEKAVRMHKIGVTKCHPKINTGSQGSTKALKSESSRPLVPKSVVRNELASSLSKPSKGTGKSSSTTPSRTKLTSVGLSRLKAQTANAKTVSLRRSLVSNATCCPDKLSSKAVNLPSHCATAQPSSKNSLRSRTVSKNSASTSPASSVRSSTSSSSLDDDVCPLNMKIHVDRISHHQEIKGSAQSIKKPSSQTGVVCGSTSMKPKECLGDSIGFKGVGDTDLAWDDAFFTSAGLLDPEELTRLMDGCEAVQNQFLPGTKEEMELSIGSISTLESDNITLESLEAELFNFGKSSSTTPSRTKLTFGGPSHQKVQPANAKTVSLRRSHVSKDASSCGPEKVSPKVVNSPSHCATSQLKNKAVSKNSASTSPVWSSTSSSSSLDDDICPMNIKIHVDRIPRHQEIKGSAQSIKKTSSQTGVVCSTSMKPTECMRNSTGFKGVGEMDLAWDDAFFSSAGLLDPEELTNMVDGCEAVQNQFLPETEEEMELSIDSISTLESGNLTLESLEAELFNFGKSRAPIQKLRESAEGSFNTEAILQGDDQDISFSVGGSHVSKTTSSCRSGRVLPKVVNSPSHCATPQASSRNSLKHKAPSENSASTSPASSVIDWSSTSSSSSGNQKSTESWSSFGSSSCELLDGWFALNETNRFMDAFPDDWIF